MPSFLDQFKRQPRLFISLPTKDSNLYDESVLQIQDQIPVTGMNTMDELLLKTPDALFSGEATERLIRSCVPSIQDAWQLTTIDVDYLLVVIRIATYGETLQINANCPKCKEESAYDLDLHRYIEVYENKNPVEILRYNGLLLTIAPLTYRKSTDIARRTYINQKTIQNINDNLNLSEDQKDLQKQKMVEDILLMNVETIMSHVRSITDGENIETNFDEILKFVNNADRDLYQQITDTIDKINQKYEIPPMQCRCIECNTDFKTAINFDYSDFFVARS
jgi:CRISPR/Cas system CMR-associated protein Cmr5 small subunit